jgi:hypothetical protein
MTIFFAGWWNIFLLKLVDPRLLSAAPALSNLRTAHSDLAITLVCACLLAGSAMMVVILAILFVRWVALLNTLAAAEQVVEFMQLENRCILAELLPLAVLAVFVVLTGATLGYSSVEWLIGLYGPALYYVWAVTGRKVSRRVLAARLQGQRYWV